MAKGVITIQFDLSLHGDKEEARLWVPYPISNPYQSVSKPKVHGTYKESKFYTDNQFGNHILYAYWPKGARERRLTLSFEVERRERSDCTLDGGQSGELKQDLRQKYLKELADKRIKALADEITKGLESPLEKAGAIYEWVTKNLVRDPRTCGCGRGDVCYTLFKKRAGKCADISSVYVELLRAAGIPARERFGLRLGKPYYSVTDITTWQHCWAEFYIPEYGWVASDPADYLKAVLTKKLCHKDPEAKRLFSYYFCSIDPFRVGLTFGRDIVLTPPQDGPPLNYFMYPYGEVGGRPLDYLAPRKFAYRITYRPLP